MDNESDNTASEQEIVDAWKQLQSAIDRAPLGELTAPIGYNLNLRHMAEHLAIREGIEELQDRAKLAHPGAIKELVYLANEIAQFLAGLPSISQVQSGGGEEGVLQTAPTEPDTTNPIKPENWQQGLKDAAEKLNDQTEDTLREGFSGTVDKLPQADFPYTYDLLTSSDDVSPSKETNMIALLCDRLIQKRVAAERSRIICELAEGLECWPVCADAIEDSRHKRIDTYLTTIGLGGDIGVNLTPGSGKGRKRELDNTSHGLAIDIYLRLNAVRKNDFSGLQVREFRKIKKSSKKGSSFKDTPYQEFEIPEPETNPRELYPVLEPPLGKPQKNIHYALKPPTIKPPLPSELPPIKALPERLPPKNPWSGDLDTFSQGDGNTDWYRKAALLPELTEDSVPKWLDAAMAYIDSQCSDDYEKCHWPQSVGDRAASKGESLKTVVREKLRLKFQHLAKHRPTY